MRIRPANEDLDLAVIQSLYDEAYPEPVPKAAQIVKNQQVRMAETDDGEVVGFRAVSPTGGIWIGVAADHRREGIGRLVMVDALEYASSLGLSELVSRVLENSAGKAFCDQFQFKPYVHAVNRSLDLTNWDDSALALKREQAQQAGIQFKTYADFGDTPENQHRLYMLNKTLSATIPRDEPQEFIAFETYVQQRLANKVLPHEGIFIALDGDDWIGMSQISLEEGYSFHHMTGVLPAYRGQDIAQALKSLTIGFAQLNHRKIIYTFNEVGNAPMIAVNEIAGFREGQRFFLVRRKPLIPTT
ncbi:MAG: GNAT family N-acetyltransferase [Anaerolineae bacterium]|nr:GNAT family N-acetyltransferase [Anaerolineae bacterium]